MDFDHSLTGQLRGCAAQWCAAHEATFARLGRTVVNDGGYFDRIAAEGASTTTATLEKFAAFLGDPGNWPGGVVPQEVCAFCHRVEGRTPAACAATGKVNGFSHSSEGAA